MTDQRHPMSNFHQRFTLTQTRTFKSHRLLIFESFDGLHHRQVTVSLTSRVRQIRRRQLDIETRSLRTFLRMRLRIQPFGERVECMTDEICGAVNLYL